MTTPSTTTKRVDEETPLLAGEREDAAKKVTPSQIPWGQFSILLILQLAEPLTSQVIYPFAPQLIRDVGVTHGDETQVGKYVGLMQSLFFATQALTVLHWGSASDVVGRKPVILTGLLGISLSMYSFGLARTFPSLVIARCLNGALNGNIGVLKSQFGALFDESNMAIAYAYLPVAWSTGSTLGPMIGGALSRPAERFPHLFGHSEFLRRYPYFLPCAVPATFAAFAWVVTFVFLKETVKSPTSIRRALFRWRRTEANLVLQNVVEGQDPSVACEPQPSASESQPTSSSSSITALAKDDEDNKPYPLRALLTRDVIVAGGNYALLSLVDIAFRGVQPLFFATPKELGGLGLEPPQIGTILSLYGIINGIFQIFFFAKINNHFGTKNTFVAGIVATVFMFALFPFISVLAAKRGLDAVVYSFIALQLVISIGTSLAYGCIFIFITAAAPNRASLGSTNGLCQMVVSWMRAVGPALANSLFSISLKQRSWTVYWVLEGLAVVAIAGACLLPRSPWRK